MAVCVCGNRHACVILTTPVAEMVEKWFRYLLIVVGDVDAGVTTPKWRRFQHSAAASNVVQWSTVEASCPGTVTALGVDRASVVVARRSALASTLRDVAFRGSRPRNGVAASVRAGVQDPGGTEVLDVQVPPSVSSEDVIRSTTVEVACDDNEHTGCDWQTYHDENLRFCRSDVIFLYEICHHCAQVLSGFTIYEQYDILTCVMW